MADWLKEQKADAAVLAALDSIAWTFNVRGQDVDHTPVALSFALVHDDGTADLFVASREDRRRRPPASRQRRPRPRARRFRARARRARRQDGRGRSRALGRGDLRGAGQGRRARSSPGATRRSCPRRSRTRSRSPATAPRRRATARRCRASSTGCRSRRPRAASTSFGRGASCRRFRQARRRPARPELRHHLRRRPERRDRPLPGQRGDQPADRDGLDLPGRFGRPISGRHHRRHPHRRDRHADGGDEGPLHPRPPGPYRGRPRALPGRARAARSSTASPASICGQAGLDYAHGTGHGVGSFLVGPRRAAAHLAGRQRPGRRRRAAQGRHDPLQRARLLQDRRIWHPRSRIWCWSCRVEVEGAEKKLLGFETLTFAPIDRNLIETAMLSRGRAALGRRLSCRGAARSSARSSTARRRPGSRRPARRSDAGVGPRLASPRLRVHGSRLSSG